MNIIKLAKEAGLLGEGEGWVTPYREAMERFAALVRAEFEAEWIETNKALAKEIVMKTEALKLAEEALESCDSGDYSTGHVIHPSFNDKAVDKAIAAIREALAEPVKKEPVGWLMTNGEFTDNKWIAHGDGPDAFPVYAAPVDAKAIRAEALEEAAKLMDAMAAQDKVTNYYKVAANAIRGLK